MDISFREIPESRDIQGISGIVSSTGFFSSDEIGIAEELITERLEKGISSGYYFVFAETGGRVVGYSCYGPIPATQSSYDLYWIAVHHDLKGMGIGKRLLEKTEMAVLEMGGKRIYAETSSRELYSPTRLFYEKNGFKEAAFLENFFGVGDGKVIYIKKIGVDA